MAKTLKKPKTSRRSVNEECISALAKEAFRFDALFSKMLSQLDEKSRKRYKNSYPWFKKKIMEVVEAGKLEIVDLTGQKYDPGMAIEVLNMSDFTEDDELYIEQMLDPIIMSRYGLVSTGKAILGKIEK